MTGADVPSAAGGDPPAIAATRRVELYGHADCCLCKTARDLLERLRFELDFELTEYDVTADEALHRAYFERVPVVTLDGKELFSFHVDEAILRARLRGG